MAPQDVPLHTIERTPQYEEFMNKLRDYHTQRGTTLELEPRVGMMHLDLFQVFNHIVENGGYDKVSDEKLAWRRMASELHLHTNNEASTAFSLKEKYYKNLAAFEISTIYGKEPPPKDILEDVTAKGGSLLSRTRENFKSAKKESAVAAADSPASGDDMTPVRERPINDASASARASRGLREAPPQRVIFQPEPGRTTRTSAAALNHTNSHGTPSSAHVSAAQMQAAQHRSRGPSFMHGSSDADAYNQGAAMYQPKLQKPFPLRPVPTPSNAPNDFPPPRPPHRLGLDPNSRQFMLPGGESTPLHNAIANLVVGFEGPNIYMRCLNALRSKIPAEQGYALNHLVKISYERGDKYKFDSFPGLAEGLVEKALTIGGLFYYVDWTISWGNGQSSDVGQLDGNYGTPDILDRISSLIEKDTPDALQSEPYLDELLQITEAVLTIRNMVTLPENARTMSDFPPLKDLICILAHLPCRDSLIELKHMALDIAEQLTPYLVLESDDPLYKTLIEQMSSEDRGTILAALRALGRISSNLEATNKLGGVPGEVLQRINSWILLNDDELMDACLDFLYQYTAVVSNVDLLLRSVIPEDLVTQLVRLMAHGARRTQREFVITPEQKLPSQADIAAMPEDLAQHMLKLEEPERVHRWVKCFFEEDSTSFVTQLAAWQAYQAAFVAPLKALGQPLISPADFIRNSTAVYKDSNAQVLREPGDPQQKFIINGIRARPRPLSLDGRAYGRCLWAKSVDSRHVKCGSLHLDSEQMWEHILTAHLGESRNDSAQFDNIEKEFVCTWGDCSAYKAPTNMPLANFARHILTHVSAILPNSSGRVGDTERQWVVPAKMLTVAYEETQTMIDERNPHLPPQAAGIPLSAVLILRNIARNVVKTEAEAELVKQQGEGVVEQGGWLEKLFRPSSPRLFEVLTENVALVSHCTLSCTRVILTVTSCRLLTLRHCLISSAS